ncbi:3-oxoacyl-[acyl-carrier-protein] reductase [Candidatus Aerophobetes bacterium]|uniref:3-oxoacyl-[acyl-carrier-protein] reductase n=1 Tax=Aerophobetes bacterium TaxID=2030807 RepID=A0A523S494_UNCAE|nr:MAG: 3-oxoacyl-[acyl-carrier-protein] reductase [Candidatus Aerophobetes bacterium]
MNLKNRVAIVTGGGQGIGKKICLRLAENEAKVAVFDINEELSQEVVKKIKAKGGDALAVKVDVAKYEEVNKATRQVIDKFKGIDILINNAGITKDSLLLRMKEEDWNRVLQVNLNGAFNCLKAVLRYMMRQKYGRVVNISSIIGIRGNIGQANYSASKAGIIGLTKSAAREVGRYGITVNAVAPGFIDTAMTRRLNKEAVDAIISQVPLQRMGKPGEVASLVTYLVSEKAAYITGEVIKIDGGMAM